MTLFWCFARNNLIIDLFVPVCTSDQKIIPLPVCPFERELAASFQCLPHFHLKLVPKVTLLNMDWSWVFWLLSHYRIFNLTLCSIIQAVLIPKSLSRGLDTNCRNVNIPYKRMWSAHVVTTILWKLPILPCKTSKFSILAYNFTTVIELPSDINISILMKYR